ncbi:hypothetical protein HJG60_007486 [Phyllostomus discolor]|uniref:Uncharacterized protein n=1 Tax=Phyllostomus discolor TaxID=89673 RepID=A0A833YRE3_9CHIR|nr:hypothetical protein HJG60_007486 [Phyllostomus discolor]
MKSDPVSSQAHLASKVHPQELTTVLSPTDVATTVDALPEENEDMHSPSTAEGDPQEVTYAQLDQWALTRRAAHTETPQPMEPTAESSVYADLSRH